MALLCQIPGMQGGALPPFYSSSCGFRCRRWYSKGPFDHLHAGLLRHLTRRGKESGVAVRFGEFKGDAVGACNQSKAKLSERKEG